MCLTKVATFSQYKILARVLANRIKTVIGTVVGNTQAYSIPGRDIADTTWTTHAARYYRESLTYMIHQKKGFRMVGLFVHPMSILLNLQGCHSQLTLEAGYILNSLPAG